MVISDSNAINRAFVFMGGTFDPIHNGHLRTALELQQWLQVEQVCLIPSKSPVHRQQPGRSSEQRLEMVQRAVADEPALQADPREIQSDRSSYTLYTLQGLRTELGEDYPICMVMGMDAYLSLPSWREWQEFIRLSHLIVVKRPGYQLPAEHQMAAYTAQYQTDNKEELFNTPAGRVIMHEQTPLGISATQIRETIENGCSPRFLIPDQVWDYIKIHQLYGLTD